MISSNNENTNDKEEAEMAVFAKPKAVLPVIRADKSHEFIQTSNKKKLTDSYLNSCKKASSLFKKNF